MHLTHLWRRICYLWYNLRIMLDWSPELGRRYARFLGVEVGDGAKIFRVSFGSEPWLIKIGRNSWVTAGTQFVTHDGSITVLKNGPFGIEDPAGLNRYGPIVVGENCFIGVQTIIMPNVTIGDHSIVAAGSVVTKNVESGTIVGGNPARVIGTVKEFAAKVLEQSLPIPSTWPDPDLKRSTIRGYFFGEGGDRDGA